LSCTRPVYVVLLVTRRLDVIMTRRCEYETFSKTRPRHCNTRGLATYCLIDARDPRPIVTKTLIERAAVKSEIRSAANHVGITLPCVSIGNRVRAGVPGRSFVHFINTWRGARAACIWKTFERSGRPIRKRTTQNTCTNRGRRVRTSQYSRIPFREELMTTTRFLHSVRPRPNVYSRVFRLPVRTRERHVRQKC